MGLSSTLIYTSELILCSAICVPSTTRHNIHMYPYITFLCLIAYLMLHNIICIAFYSGLGLPHLGHADTMWRDQPGLKSEMKKIAKFSEQIFN